MIAPPMQPDLPRANSGTAVPQAVRFARWLLLAAVVLPAAILLGNAGLSWHAARRQATTELSRTVDAAAEYARRLLDSHRVLAAQVNDLLRGLSDAEIDSARPPLQLRLDQLVLALAQPVQVAVHDREGRLLLASRNWPGPAEDEQTAQGPAEVALGPVIAGMAGSGPVFTLALRRDGTGNGLPLAAFDGRVSVTVPATPLGTGLRRLAGQDSDALGLLRNDGEVLTRSQGLTLPMPRVAPDRPFHRIVAEGREQASYVGPSSSNGAETFFALRRVEGYPVYAVAHRPRSAVQAQWYDAMALQAGIALPATLALLLLALMVRQSQRELMAANASLEARVGARTAALEELSRALDLTVTLVVDLNGRILHWSEGCERLYGFTAPQALGRTADELLRTEFPAGGPEAARRAVRQGGEWHGELHQEAADGTRLVVSANWILRRDDASGLPVAVVETHTDATALKRTEAALVASEARLRRAQDAAGAIAFELTAARREPGRGRDAGAEPDLVVEAPEAFRALYALPPSAPLDQAHVLAQVHPDDRPGLEAEQRRLLRDGGAFQREFRVLRPDGSVRWLLLRGEALEGEAPLAPRQITGVVMDITDRRAAEERSALLMREVDHRAKNALAVVQAALRLTRAEDTPSYVRAVEGRVAALARAHSMLAQRRWTGAELQPLLEGELGPYVAGADTTAPRVMLSGPQVLLDPKAAQPLAMALHELASNAVEHGALSVPEGRLLVAWQVDPNGPWLQLTWQELGGPVVVPPSRAGFGGRVVDGTLRGQLGGSISRRWLAGGLVCEIRLPLPAQAAAPLQAANSNSAAA